VQTLLEKDEVDFTFCYPDDLGIVEKAETVARRVYRAAGVSWSTRAKRQLDRIAADGFGRLPVCFAKTQYSFSTDPAARGAPEGHVVDVREVRLSAGAGFVVLVAGDVMTMPGLPRVPASAGMSIDEAGRIRGLS
jgi:formate--tetrahydrofolate ligase